jgi:hypothetical protein
MKRIVVRHKVKPGRAAFRAFTENVKERCEEPPVASQMTEAGSYRFFTG